MADKINDSKLRGIIGLTRPFTLLPPIVAVVCGGLIALGHYGYSVTGSNLGLLIWAGMLLATVNAASNALNQVYDADIDRINKPTRPIPRGTWTPRETMCFAGFLYFVVFLLAFTVGKPFTVFAFMFILVTILYSVPPLRLKQRLWISNITIAVARSWILLLAGWSIFPFASLSEPTIWFVGLIMFVFLFGASTTKDFTDIKGDRKYGMNTLPVKYGVEKTALMICPFFILPFVLIPFGASKDLLPMGAMKLTPMIGWAFYVVIILGSIATAPNKKLENSKMWFHMYAMMMAIMIGVALCFVW